MKMSTIRFISAVVRDAGLITLALTATLIGVRHLMTLPAPETNMPRVVSTVRAIDGDAIISYSDAGAASLLDAGAASLLDAGVDSGTSDAVTDAVTDGGCHD